MSAEPVAQSYATFETLRSEFVREDPRNLDAECQSTVRGRSTTALSVGTCSQIPGICFTDAERAELSGLRDPARREAWQWGRVLAKQLLREQLPDLVARDKRIEVFSRNDESKSVRPTVRVNGAPLDVYLSISHSSRGVFVALSEDRRLGVDLVDLTQFRPGTLNVWFTPAERERLIGDNPTPQATLWSIKEAVYKAANTGEPFAPQAVEVDVTDGEYRCTYRGRNLRDECRIQVSAIDGHVAAVATWQTCERTDMNRSV